MQALAAALSAWPCSGLGPSAAAAAQTLNPLFEAKLYDRKNAGSLIMGERTATCVQLFASACLPAFRSVYLPVCLPD
jgi:hypothetical protein